MFVRILNGVFEGSFRAYVKRYVRVYRDSACSHHFVYNATGMVEGFRWHVFLSGGLSLNLTRRNVYGQRPRVRLPPRSNPAPPP